MQPHVDNSLDAPVSTLMRWKPLALFIPVALVINAAVAYLGWLIWATRF